MSRFIIGRIRSIKFALKGFFLLLFPEHSIITQVGFSLAFAGLGLYLGISRTDWMLQILACGLILTAESLNTAVEKVCDFIHPDFHDRIGFIKDIASGAVAFAVLTALVIALLIYWPYFTG